MIPKYRTAIHPGTVLQEDFLKPLGIKQTALAALLEIPVQRVNEIVKGKRGISFDTAWKLADAFGTTPQFWLNLDNNYELSRRRPIKRVPHVGELVAA